MGASLQIYKERPCGVIQTLPTNANAFIFLQANSVCRQWTTGSIYPACMKNVHYITSAMWEAGVALFSPKLWPALFGWAVFFNEKRGWGSGAHVVEGGGLSARGICCGCGLTDTSPREWNKKPSRSLKREIHNPSQQNLNKWLLREYKRTRGSRTRERLWGSVKGKVGWP